METLFSWLDSMLPFAWIGYDFMKRAFIAVLIITPMFGMMGTMIVNKQMAFFSDALGHSALTGIAVGVVMGMTDTSVAMTVFAVVFALALNQIRQRNLTASDTVISVFSSCSIALGLLILSRGGKFSQYSSLLVGDILSISEQEIKYLFAVLILTFVFWLVCFNWLNATSIHVSLAKSRNIPVWLIENIFAVFIAVVVMQSIRWVGILLINALLILPAAASRNISENMREYHLFSIIFSVFSGILGLVLSFYLETASGPMIVIIASIIFFCTYAFASKVKTN